MKTTITNSPKALGERAAALAADVIREAIAANGRARVVFSTGASQIDTISALTRQDIDWLKVEGFHLDEYIGISRTHPASFRKYLKDRLLSVVPIDQFHFIETDIANGDIDQSLERLTKEIQSAPIDLGLIGIGENGHVAFNDPPADFNNDEAFAVVTLDSRCKEQQVREGWFPTLGDVPNQAVTMTVRQIMRCRMIISAVPYMVKAPAIKWLFDNDSTPAIPATILKGHEDFHLLLDRDSAALIEEKPRP